MDSFTLTDDIKVVCVAAKQFPDDIERAHIHLHVILPEKERRRFFGISWRGPDGKIIYKAAADLMEHETAEQYGLDTFTIKKGPYNAFYIKDFMEDPESIGRAFQLLIAQHEVDPNGYCLEWYIGDNDVKCMVPLGEKYQEFTGLNKE